MALDRLVLEAPGSLHSWVPLGCNSWRDSAGRLPFPAHCTDSRPKHSPSLSEPGVYLFVQELWPEGQASGWHTCWSLWKCPQGTETSGHKLCPLPLCLIPACWYLPELRLSSCPVPWFLWLLSGDTSPLPGSGDQGSLYLLQVLRDCQQSRVPKLLSIA